MATKKIVALALISAFAGSAQMAQATDVFRLEGYGAVSHGMGGTSVAQDVGPAGMMTNPSTLSLMPEGNEAMVGLDIVTTSLKVTDKNTGETVSSSTHNSNRGPYYAPEAAFTKRVGAWAFGVGAFAQGGLGTEYGTSSFLSRALGVNTGLENSSRLLVLNIPFAASFQVNDKLAIGGSLDAMWQGLNLNLLLGADQVGSLIGAGRATGALVPVLGGMAGLRGAHFSLTKNEPLASGVEAWGYGGRLGMVFKATPDTTLGASYSMKGNVQDMEGRATLTAIQVGNVQTAMNGNIKIKDFQMPANATVGVTHHLNSQWTVAADVSRIFWKDVMKDIKVAFVADSGLDLNINLPQDYKDQNVLALGAAYQMNDQLTLRGGLRFASQALQSSTVFAVIPATPKRHLSAGLTYALSKQSKIDFAYSHAFEEKMDNTSLPNTSEPIQTKHSQDNATINYRYSF